MQRYKFITHFFNVILLTITERNKKNLIFTNSEYGKPENNFFY